MSRLGFANLAALDAGAEVVAGRRNSIASDAGRLPVRLLEDDEKRVTYDKLLDEIHAKLRSGSCGSWPGH